MNLAAKSNRAPASARRRGELLTNAVWLYPLVVLGIVMATTVVRLIAASTLPLTGDEAYYWEWSRHPALGYFDHPPMVAWLITLFASGSKQTLFIRLPFVLCGLGSSLAVFAFVARATDKAAAGATAALLLSLMPFANIAFTVASPDGPYLLFWSIALYCALRALQPGASIWRLPLAASIGLCVLSRLLGLVLFAGLVFLFALRTGSSDAARAPQSRHNLAAAALLAAIVFPYVLWNAAHGWRSIQFQLIWRHQAIPGGNAAQLLGLWIAVLTPGVAIAATAALRKLVKGRSPADAIVLWTSVPLLVLCLLMAFRERVEFYWADGAFISLIAGVGLYWHALLRGARYAWVVGPAAVLACLLFSVLTSPLQFYRVLDQKLGVHLRHGGPFEIWSYEPAAKELASQIRGNSAWVMTDGYGLSSVLDFYGGMTPVVIGYDAQGRELRSYLSGPVPTSAIFFDKEPLQTRPDFQLRLRQACARVVDEGQRSYFVGGVLARTYYLSRCEGLTPNGFALLQWQEAAAQPVPWAPRQAARAPAS